MYQVVKRYGHDIGLSCVFRQWRADSHCSKLHGYALAVEITFESDTLDKNFWVIDFGALKPVKKFLYELFDHKFLIAADDPDKYLLCGPRFKEMFSPVVVKKTGCEGFAELIFDAVKEMIDKDVIPGRDRVRIVSVKVSEHGANSALYFGDKK